MSDWKSRITEFFPHLKDWDNPEQLCPHLRELNAEMAQTILREQGEKAAADFIAHCERGG